MERSPTWIDWAAGPADGSIPLPAWGGAVGERAPVLMVPGYGRSPQWSFYPHLAAQLAEVRPVWAVPCQDSPIACLDALERMLLAWRQGRRPPGWEQAHGAIGLLGHGAGGTLALLAAARNLGAQAVMAVSAYASLPRAVDGAARDELAAAPHRFHVEAAARGLQVPVVLLHGEEDGVAPFADAELLFHWLPKERARLVLLEKTGHSLGASEPFAGETKEVGIAVHVARDFFR